MGDMEVCYKLHDFIYISYKMRQHSSMVVQSEGDCA